MKKAVRALLELLLRLSKKAKPFLTKGLRPAAAHKSSAKSGRFPRLQAEKCFLPRTRRGKKRSDIYFAAAAAKLYEVY